ncbi:MAG: class I SAM-dependent methyltransferase [Candidatus Nanopelagicales bacterium]
MPPADGTPAGGTAEPLPPLTPNAWLRWDVVRTLLPAGQDALEVGCGLGAVGTRLARRYRYTGLEPDPDSYAVAATRIHPPSRVLNGSLDLLGSDERFDLVCAFEVIEHLPEDDRVLADWAARLRPGGHLLLSTPGHPERFGPADELAGHLRRYRPDGLAALLVAAGLVDVEVVPYGGPLSFVLETGRNTIARRRLRTGAGAAHEDAAPAERTAGSGRLLQPSAGAAGVATRYGTAPFRLLQRRLPLGGTGLVARGRAPG